ncbi:hypothetical protein [Insolitispirillum peregrinum]
MPCRLIALCRHPRLLGSTGNSSVCLGFALGRDFGFGFGLGFDLGRPFSFGRSLHLGFGLGGSGFLGK